MILQRFLNFHAFSWLTAHAGYVLKDLKLQFTVCETGQGWWYELIISLNGSMLTTQF